MVIWTPINLQPIASQSHMHELPHCKTQQAEPAYIEWGNSAAAMQVNPVFLLDMKICS